jgi:tetratricopeptide (TPR) repeat protein
MASIIPGYEYDIFISYRQKDNKGDRWVSEFVDALKTELESTFKEEISVYFDINPHDGLLETHNINASLKEKLKCLVFIPIISQTYCDPQSYAWQSEFVAFNKLEHAYYDSTRILLEKRIIDLPEDQRLYSSLGIAYAGLGLNEKAIRAGEKAIKLLPVSKEAYKGPFLVEDLAQIYVMVGKYDDAIRQIKYLLSIPGLLSTKILELDPRWAPLRNRPEFKKMMESYSGK